MPQINHDTITQGAILFRNTSTGSVVAPESVSDIERDSADPSSSFANFHIPEIIESGGWEIVLRKGSVFDDSGGTNQADVVIHQFAILLPPAPTTDIRATYEHNENIEIIYTAPDGYTLDPTKIITATLFFNGLNVGQSTSNFDRTILIGGPPNTGWEIQSSGFYTNGQRWELTQTYETIQETIPVTQRLLVSLAEELASTYTLDQTAPNIQIDVQFISPTDTATLSQLESAIIIKEASSGTEISLTDPFATITTQSGDGSNIVVMRYTFPRAFQSGTWEVIAKADIPKDSDGLTLPYDEVLGSFEGVAVVPGAEEWSAGNPPNPIYPRVPPASFNDLMGSALSAGGTTISNLFDLGVDAEVTINDGKELIEDISINGGSLCFRINPFLTNAEWNYRLEHFAQRIDTDTAFEIELGDHLNSLYIIVDSHDNGKPVLAIDSSGMTSGDLRMLPSTEHTVVIGLENGPRGVLRFTARNYSVVDFTSNSTTVGASDRSLCVKQSSNLKYYDVRVMQRNDYSDPIADGTTRKVAAGSSFYDIGFGRYAGELDTYDFTVNGVSASQIGGTVTVDGLQVFTMQRQNLSGFTYYFTRIFGVLADPLAIQTTVNLSDGQVFSHSHTMEVAAYTAAGIYGVSEGQVFSIGDTVQWYLGDSDPDRVLSSVAFSTPTTSTSLPVVSSANLYTTEITSYSNALTWTATYTYTTGDPETFTITASAPEPPPVAPDPPTAMLFADTVQAGRRITGFVNTGNVASRVIEYHRWEIGGATTNLAANSTNNTVSYAPVAAGPYTLTYTLKFTDWATEVTATDSFTAVLPPPPQGLSAALDGGQLRVKWQEPGVEQGAFAASYIVSVAGTSTTATTLTTVTEDTNHTYRYGRVALPTEPVTITVAAVWGGDSTGPSVEISWVPYEQRTIGQIGEDGPVELVTVAEAVGLTAPSIPGAASTAGNVAYQNAIINNPLNSIEVAGTAFLQEFNRNTLDAWQTIVDTAPDGPLRVAAQQNVELFQGNADGLVGLSKIATDCYIGVSGACGVYSLQWADYMAYTDFIRSVSANEAIGFFDWIDAGLPGP